MKITIKAKAKAKNVVQQLFFNTEKRKTKRNQ